MAGSLAFFLVLFWGCSCCWLCFFVSISSGGTCAACRRSAADWSAQALPADGSADRANGAELRNAAFVEAFDRHPVRNAGIERAQLLRQRRAMAEFVSPQLMRKRQ